VFISGETIDLSSPIRADAGGDVWFEWFNDGTTTKYLDQGVYPNSREKQVDFYDSLIRDPPRLALMIREKGAGDVVGIVSLSSIDFRLRKAQIALVKGRKTQHPKFHALEAMARMTEHAFEKFTALAMLCAT